MHNGRLIAVIPARGGSKRIPRKNIIDFHGKPLIAWTIEAAKDSRLFAKVIISTEDEEIKNVAVNYGAEVPFFRDKAFDDQSPVSEAVIATLKQIEANLKEQYDVVVLLMPPSPLRTHKHILQAYNNFVNTNATSQISCFELGLMNPWWAVKLDSDFKPTWVFPENYMQPKQELPKLFCPSGAIWISKVKTLYDSGSFYSPEHIFYPMDWKYMLDIDDVDDLEMAKLIYLMQQQK